LKKPTDTVAQAGFNPSLEETICTLYEKDYHFGLAAFVNSLVHKGFNGTVWVGYRDGLPPWLHQLQPHTPVKSSEESIPSYLVDGQIRIIFIQIDPNIHLANFKPQFMLQILKNYSPESRSLWYFDPDIYLVSSWKMFSKWTEYGIAVCADINFSLLHENAPLRRRWMEFVSDIAKNPPRAMNHYFNSGAIGVSREFISILEIWESVLIKAGSAGYDLDGLFPETRDELFYAVDQDAMNIALMYTIHPISPLGREAMGFEPGGAVLYHTVGPKPWRGTLKRALKGHAPSNGARYYFTQATSPIHPYSRAGLFMRRVACSLASFIGRFYDRPTH
jgi:hypothetical protein